MSIGSEQNTFASRARGLWLGSMGVQAWLLDGARYAVFRLLDRGHVRPQDSIQDRSIRAEGGRMEQSTGAPSRTVDGMRALIHGLEAALEQLDDVEDYPTIGEIDDDMYGLWKELERKMQRHRQSEAKAQLKGMFRI